MKILLSTLFFLAAWGGFAAHIGYVYPAGGRAGTTVELLIGGRELWGMKTALVSGGGIKTLGVELVPGIPTTGGEQNKFLRDWLGRIERGKPEPPEKPEDIRDWRQCRYFDDPAGLTELQRELVTRRVFTRPDPLQSSPAISQLAIVRLEIAPDATPGRRELRLAGKTRLSDPLPFYVGDAKEICEPRFAAPSGKAPAPTGFGFPAVLNGQILPGETDTFRFAAEKGDVVYFVLRGRALTPFLGDGVPGHFQPILEIYDASGKLTAAADDRYFDPDPALEFSAPAAGNYTLKVRDALYRGREDFVYRIDARRGELPPLEIVEPPPPAGYSWQECEPETELSVPAFVRFKLADPGAKRVFRFRGTKNEPLILEVLARRQNSPLDARLILRDASGKVLAENDDFKRPRIGAVLHQADPEIHFTPPATGAYDLEVCDASGSGGAESAGFLRIDTPRPDFDLYVRPSAVTLSDASPAVVRVLAVRRDGFTGEIILGCAPESPFRIVGENSLPSGADSGIFTLAAVERKLPDGMPRPVELFGVSGALRHPVRAADEAMQAFAYTHLVPAESLLAMYDWAPYGARWFRYVDPRFSLTIKPGETAEIRLWSSRVPPSTTCSFSLIDAPTGVAVAEVRRESDMTVVTIRAEANITPSSGGAVLNIECGFTNKNGKPQKSSFVLPAFRLEVKK